jgi:hypothetical protein
MLSVLAAIDVVLVAVNLVITGKVITNISPELVISVVYQWRRQPLYALLLYVCTLTTARLHKKCP